MAIPEKMKALVAYSKEDYKLVTDFPTPKCGPDDVTIKTEGCGVCVSDLKCSHGAAMYWGDKVQPAWVKPPFIPGHEFLGTIVEMGAGVKGFALGDRVTADLKSWISQYLYIILRSKILIRILSATGYWFIMCALKEGVRPVELIRKI
jgi:D-arabinose 1-dehydrogenase-like Zn-dependent alcohol dehydrogenase